MILAQHFGSLENVSKAPLETLESIFEVGPVVAESVSNSLLSPSIRRLSRSSVMRA